MSKWLVTLTGESASLHLLVDMFESPDLKVTKEGDGYVLWAAEIDSLADRSSAEEQARRTIAAINGALKVHQPVFRPVQLGSVIEVMADGKRAYAVSASVSVGFEVRVLLPTPVSDQERKDVRAKVELVKSDAAVSKALHYFSENWVDLYKVYEVIREDEGGDNAIVDRGYATRADLNRFKMTAQSAAALGDAARHAAKKFQPPRKPMSLPDAVAFVRRLLASWMKAKS